MKAGSASSSIMMLKIIIGVFFIVLGICGVSNLIDESVFRLSHNYTQLEIIFGIIEIICGVVIIFGHLFFSAAKSVYWGSLIILIFWLIRIFLTKFVWGLTFINNGEISFPAFFVWLLILSMELAVAAALYVIIVRND